MSQIDHYLRTLIEQNGSDLHFIAGQPPRMRLYGHLDTVEDELLAQERTEEVLGEIMNEKDRNQFEEHDSVDFAYMIDGLARFRVNIMRHLGGMGGVFRAIPSQAKSLEELALPPVLKTLCKETQGMILVTGKTGSGKSTTLAAMIAEINSRMKGHILTIEDPIEFVHERNRCLISQRELGHHCKSFSGALHSALREDPDVILVGEMRDLETVSIAVTAAEMGILVMGTLHTNGAGATVDRIVNVFPTDKQPHVRTMLSTSLRGVISQQLIPRKGADGLVAALEILISTPATSNMIRQGKLDQLETAMQAGRKSGMITMDKALSDLFDKGGITGKSAYEFANDKDKFHKHRLLTE
ncbi:MAG: type IV pili twitching motility protein PilT [Chromatiales bacterium]|jgi:twitching motility protein PilT|nr:type IV pili twitching motility protein PilT [Chromatiales bacterium]MDP6150214.1 type IV pilus twitching motility protein PilT [Gammaproteobacteria bacterium]MDP7092912.1 type IV pilus twitching motility protein PilT [Gammaproteobacteria bacterium]MDP7270354.1 type IV pilus twitching motility protein PilT [Gammaproteobacteria bacterium]HJP04901.1 type IV pilus twitching motility protein PilT [Gammaproteobacteria bacterium]